MTRPFPKTREILSRLIAFPTVSSQSNLELVEYLAELAEELGARVHFDHDPTRRKANLVMRLGPHEAGGLLLCGHTDVVPTEGQKWTHDPFRLQEGRNTDGQEVLFGRGTSDMKAFIAHAFSAMRRVENSSLVRPLVGIWTYDEELGCIGASRLVEGLSSQKAPLPDVALVGEPTEFQIFVAHKGHTRFDVEVRGVGGHSSRPDHGVSAISFMARAIDMIDDIFLEQRFHPRFEELFPEYPFPTVNFGRIEGGQAINMIPETCRLSVGYRTMPGDDPLHIAKIVQERLEEEIQPVLEALDPRANIKVVFGTAVPALQAKQRSSFEHLLGDILDDDRRGAAPFTTEASTFAAVGVTSIVCGPGNIAQAHQPDEFISLADFSRGCGVVEEVIRRVCL